MPLLVAHRFPDTDQARKRLIAAGASGFELDVQFGPHGEVVVSHYLPFLRIRGWLEHDSTHFRWRSGSPRDPSLREAVERLPADSQILLDPKEYGRSRRRRLVTAVATVLQSLDPSRFAVSTDGEEELAAYRAEAGIRTWRTVGEGGQLERLLAADGFPDDGVSVRHTLLTRDRIDRLHQVTDTVVAWTVNDVGRAEWLRGAGVDGITTDHADVMASLRG